MNRVMAQVDAIEQQREADLIADARQGDAEAYCELARVHEIRLLRQAWQLSGRQESARDLVQQTLIDAWQSFGRFHGGCRFSTWLYAILLHKHQKQLRQAVRRRWLQFGFAWQEGPARDPLDEAPLPDAALARDERARWVRQSLAGLSAVHREVICLRFFEEASLAEMASVLGCSTGTVKSRLHNAMERLRLRLRRHEFEEEYD